MTHTLILVSFLAGLIPSILLAVLYGFWAPWERTQAGRALFYLVAVTAGSYLLSTLVTLFPAYFGPNGGGLWIRIALRLAIAGVLWNLFRLFIRAQRSGRRDDRE